VIDVCRRRLAVEPPDPGLGGELAGEDHLERHGAFEAHLPRPEGEAHIAAGQLTGDLIVAEVPDAGQLANLRHDSRERMSRSPLMDAQRLTRGLEVAYLALHEKA
jgi:hypothetical protein